MPQSFTFGDASPATAPANIPAAPAPPGAAATNWQYGAWRRETGFAAQRAMLILHIEEITERITESTSGGGQSVSADALERLRDQMQEQLDKLERAVGGTLHGGGTLHAAFNRGC